MLLIYLMFEVYKLYAVKKYAQQLKEIEKKKNPL